MALTYNTQLVILSGAKRSEESEFSTFWNLRSFASLRMTGWLRFIGYYRSFQRSVAIKKNCDLDVPKCFAITLNIQFNFSSFLFHTSYLFSETIHKIRSIIGYVLGLLYICSQKGNTYGNVYGRNRFTVL